MYIRCYYICELYVLIKDNALLSSLLDHVTINRLHSVTINLLLDSVAINRLHSVTINLLLDSVAINRFHSYY